MAYDLRIQYIRANYIQVSLATQILMKEGLHNMSKSTQAHKPSSLDLPRNVWAVSLTSFLMDISSEMVINILPLFLANVLGVRTNIIGFINGLAESTPAYSSSSQAGFLTSYMRENGWRYLATRFPP